jgi:hypothetical protein
MSLSIRQSLLAFCSLLFLSACEDPTEIGVNQPQSNQIGVFFTDTFTLKTSTILLDKVVAAAPNNYPSTLLAGRYNDPLFGNITAQSYTTVYQGTKFNPGEAFVSDSLVLYLFYDYSYGDVNQPQSLSVHYLNDSLDYNKTYYHTDEVAYGQALGNATFLPKFRLSNDTSKEDTLRSLKIKFEETVGKELGNLILNLPTLSNDISKFNKTFKGLALIPEPSNTGILGFNTYDYYLTTNRPASFLRLYYHNNTEAGKQLKQDFFLGNFFVPPTNTVTRSIFTGSSFNQVKADRSGTALAGLSLNNPIPSSQSENVAYIQSALGIATKIEFPFIRSFREKGRVGINKAELIIQATPASSSKNLSLPSEVVLAESNGENQIAQNSAGVSLYVQQEGVGVNQTAAPASAFLSSGNYNFTFTSYLQAMLSGIDLTDGEIVSGKKTNRGLILMSSPFYNSASLKPGIQGGLIKGNSQIKLRVHYTYLK